jgi:C_GCAxxG_C_C family probable redox protein
MTSNAEKAVTCFDDGFNCAQAILSTYGPLFGVARPEGLRIAGAFGAGMGRLGETCGAVTGAFMVIGLMHAKTLPEGDAEKEEAYALVHEFRKRFLERNKSIACKVLLQCDLSTPVGLRYAVDTNLVKTRCPKFVRDAAEILEDLIAIGRKLPCCHKNVKCL